MNLMYIIYLWLKSMKIKYVDLQVCDSTCFKKIVIQK